MMEGEDEMLAKSKQTDEAVDQQWHDEKPSKMSEEPNPLHPSLGGKFLMSSYSEQSGRRFWVESERASSHKSSLGSQGDEEAEAMAPNQELG
eukprot:12418844-Karenia_brevis.AAC.1